MCRMQNKIIVTACRANNVPVREIFSPRSTRDLTVTRYEIIVLLFLASRQHKTVTSTAHQRAGLFGMNHSNDCYARKVINNLMIYHGYRNKLQLMFVSLQLESENFAPDIKPKRAITSSHAKSC